MHFDGNNGVIDFIHYISIYGSKVNLFFSPQNFVFSLSSCLTYCQSYPLLIPSSLFSISLNTLKHSCFMVCLIIPVFGVFVGLFMLSVVSGSQ